MFYTYALKSRKNPKFYIGSTIDLKRRILEHNTKNEKRRFACVNGPWDLIFFKVFNTRAESIKYEKFLKSGKDRKFIINFCNLKLRIGRFSASA